MGAKLKGYAYQYRHAAILSYFFVYIGWFLYLEEHVRVKYVIHSWLDAHIPFQEVFIIPYFFWFFYVGAALVYFMIKSKEDFFRTCIFLFTGMTACLILYSLFPNGHYLRPHSFARDNILVDMVKMLYASDTSTNVCPSIHALNSIGINIAIWTSALFREKKKIRIFSLILMVLICMSTVFLKQHSINDVFYACLLCIPLYLLAYRVDWKQIYQNRAEKLALKQSNRLRNH